MDILEDKYKLVISENYKRIRNYQLEVILRLANSNIEPLELKGMLKLIAKTDNWKDEFLKKHKNEG